MTEHIEDCKKFFQELPKDIQEGIDSFNLKNDLEENRGYATKQLIKIFEDEKSDIDRTWDTPTQIRSAYGLLLKSIISRIKASQRVVTIKQVIPISAKEKIEFLLKDKELLNKVIKACQLLNRLVGEEKSITEILLVVLSIYLENVNDTSKNLHADDESGIGKDFLIKAVSKLFPSVQWIHITDPSPKSLTYLSQPASDEDAITITRKTVFHLEDTTDAFINGSDFKLYCSGELNKRTVTPDRKSQLLKLEKAVTFVSSCDTSTTSQLNRRFRSLGLDSSVSQTKNIIRQQKKDSKELPQNLLSKDEKEEVQLTIDALMSLEDVWVIIPELVGNEIEKFFGENPDVSARTLHKTVEDYVKMSGVIHQFQRTKSLEKAIVDGKEYKTIFANLLDWEIVKRTFFTDAKLGDNLLPFNKRQRLEYEEFQKPEIRGRTFRVEEIMQWKCCKGISDQTVRLDLKKITEHTILKMEKGEEKNVWLYKYPIQIKSVKSEPKPYVESVDEKKSRGPPIDTSPE